EQVQRFGQMRQDNTSTRIGFCHNPLPGSISMARRGTRTTIPLLQSSSGKHDNRRFANGGSCLSVGHAHSGILVNELHMDNLRGGRRKRIPEIDETDGDLRILKPNRIKEWMKSPRKPANSHVIGPPVQVIAENHAGGARGKKRGHTYELHLCFSDFTTGQCCDVQFDCLKVLNFQLDVAALKGSDESRIRMKGCLKREIAISSRQPKTPA